MMTLTCDIHTHTIASGHAYGTIREMAQAASEKGLSLLGLSEHGPGIPGTCDPFYFKALDVIPRTLYGVHIIHGCELNVTNDGVNLLDSKCMKKLDYALAGIHITCYENAGMDQNTDNVIAFMKDPKVCFISHPDDSHTPLCYPRLVEAAKTWHVALEVNSSSFRKPNRLNFRENYTEMLQLCEKMDVPIIVSSDAHDPFWVGMTREAEAFLEEVHFPERLILNVEESRILDFIGLSEEIFG